MNLRRFRQTAPGRILLACMAACVLGFAGCETVYVPATPGRYIDANIAFSYPSDWKIPMREVTDSGTALLLEPSRQGLVFIKGYRATEAGSLQEFANEFSLATARRANGVQQDTKSFRLVRSGVMEERFDVIISGSAVPHVRRYYRREAGDGVYFIVTHVPEEDANGAGAGFDQVLGSFRLHVPGAS